MVDSGGILSLNSNSTARMHFSRMCPERLLTASRGSIHILGGLPSQGVGICLLSGWGSAF